MILMVHMRHPETCIHKLGLQPAHQTASSKPSSYEIMPEGGDLLNRMTSMKASTLLI